ncbi:MAG: hypothetical protein ACD_75C01138G0003 [uncultured bacterium]|nr:MAG: hypothetical protein ACD_75C01138G0003 [uncultured bacterium]
MQPLLLLILVSYLLVHAVETVLTLMNLKHLSIHGGRVPAGFAETIDSGLLVKTRDYTLATSRLDLVSSFVTAAVTLIFFFGGVLNSYNDLIRGMALGAVWSGVLFFLLLSFAPLLLNIPFSLYSTFHIEKKYGFNTQTMGLWFADMVKSLLLSVLLNGLLLLAVFWLIDRFSGMWWLLAWGVLFIFSIFLLYVSPYLIEPLFNKFTPIADSALEEEIRELMQRAGIAVSRVFTMDASKRSRHSNAYFSGIGHVKRIVLFDTLLQGNGAKEILAILAHETGHWKKKHILKKLAVMEVLALLGLYLIFLVTQGNVLPTIFGVAQPAMPVKILLAGFVGSIIWYPFQFIGNAVSRRQEIEADDFAAELTGDPRALARSLVNLSRENLANLHPHPLYAAFHYSHPPLAERVARLQNMK